MNLSLISKYRGQIMGVAILLVALFHSSIIQMNEGISMLCFLGDMGVDLFFIISGFGIYFTYQKKPSIFSFYKKRALRIVPIWMITNLFVHLYYTPLAEMDWDWFIKCLTGFNFWLEGSLYYWYIPCILMFYLLTPFFMALYHKNKKKAYLAMIVVWFILLGICLILHNGKYFIFVFRFPIYFMGIGLGELASKKTEIKKQHLVGLLISFLVGLCLIFIVKRYHETTFIRYDFKYLAYYFTGIPFCVLLSFLFDKVKYGFPVLKFLGGITLEIYLFHEFILRKITYRVGEIPFDQWYVVFNILVFLFVVGVSYLVHLGMEWILKQVGKNENIKACTEVFSIVSVLSAVFLYYFSGSTSPVIPGYYGEDSAIFQVIGKSWTQGILPYVGTFDHKGPFIFLVNAMGYSMGSDGLLAVQWIFMVGTYIGVYKIARLFVNHGYGVLITIASYFVLLPTYGFGNYTEEYALVFLVFSLYMGLKYFLQIQWEKCESFIHPWKYAVFYGISFAVIGLMRVTSALSVCCIILVVSALLLYKKKWKNFAQNAGGFLLGCFSVLLPFCIYFMWKSALYDMIYGTILHNLQYANSSSIFAATGVSWKKAFLALAPTASLIFLSLLFLISQKRKERIIAVYGMLAGVLSIVLFAGINRYLHYYMISFPFFVISVGMTVLMMREKEKHVVAKLCVIMAWACIFLQISAGVLEVIKRPADNENLRNYAMSYQVCAEKIMENIPEEEYGDALVFGGNTLSQWYLVADLKPSYKYCFLQGWMSKSSEGIKADVTGYLQEKPAKWLIVDADINSETMLENHCADFVKSIEARYVLVETAKMEREQRCVQLYRLNQVE